MHVERNVTTLRSSFISKHLLPVETVASQRVSAASLERKPRITFKNLQLQTRSLAFAPQTGSMSRAIQERASVGALTALDGAGDANKLRFERVAANANDRITMTTHVDERNVRRQIRVR